MNIYEMRPPIGSMNIEVPPGLNLTCLRSKDRSLDSYSQSQSQGRRCVPYVCYDPGGDICSFNVNADPEVPENFFDDDYSIELVEIHRVAPAGGHVACQRLCEWRGTSPLCNTGPMSNLLSAIEPIVADDAMPMQAHGSSNDISVKIV